MAQLLSMIFGVIRNKQEKEMSLKQQVNESSGMRNGSKDLFENNDSFSSMHSVNTQYFDPPIEHYMILNKET